MKIPLTTLEAIIGLKIQQCDLELKSFPGNDYQRGARDQAVNLLIAIRKASNKPENKDGQ